MRVFIGLKDFQTKLPGLTILDFFLSATSMTKLGTYPLISKAESVNLVKVKAAIIRIKTYYKTYCPKYSEVYRSMDIALIMDRIETICKWTKIRGKQFLCENMTVLYVIYKASTMFGDFIAQLVHNQL